MRYLFAFMLVAVGVVASACGGGDDAKPTPRALQSTTDTTIQTAVASATAPAPTKAAATPEQQPKVGEAVSAGGSTYTVNTVVDPYVREDGYFKPPAGERAIAFDITQVVTEPKGDSYNTLDYALQDDKGYIYRPNQVAPDPGFGSGSLPVNGKVRGWIAFHVPADAVLVTLLVEATPVGQRTIIAGLQ